MRGKRRLNVLGLIIALALGFGCLLFILPAALSDNLLFAFDTIQEKPTQAILYHRGMTYIYYPDSPEYDLLVDAAYQTLYHEVGIDESGWSGLRFDQARNEGVSVELLYAEPVKLPGRRVDIADTYRLFFPLEVFGWNDEVVFRGGQTMYWGLPIQVDTLDRLRDAVAELGLD